MRSANWLLVFLWRKFFYRLPNAKMGISIAELAFKIHISPYITARGAHSTKSHSFQHSYKGLVTWWCGNICLLWTWASSLRYCYLWRNSSKFPYSSIILAATKQLYEWFSPSVCPSVRLSVTPFWQRSDHRIITKISGVIIIEKSNVHAKGQSQRPKVKVTEVETNLTVSGVGCCNSYASLSITQVKIYSCSYLIKRWFSLFNFYLNLTRKQKFTIIMNFCQVKSPQNEHICNSSLNSPMAMKWCTIKAWCSIEEVPYYFLRSSIKFQNRMDKKWKIWIQFE